MAVFDDGSGPLLYLGGAIDDGFDELFVVRGDGQGWSSIDTGLQLDVHVLQSFKEAGSQRLYSGGIGGVYRLDCDRWTDLGAPTGSISDLHYHHNGISDVLIAAGYFFGVAGPVGLAQWDGMTWSALGSPGITGGGLCHALSLFDTPGGSALHVGGFFTAAFGTPASNVALLGQVGAPYAAAPLGSGTNGQVTAMAVFDSGSGPELVVSGAFTSPAMGIARWNGSNWNPMGPGFAFGGFDRPLEVQDDGTGPALYTAGTIAGSRDSSVHVWRWDGTTWTSLGEPILHSLSGPSGAVYAFTIFNDGSGPALYAAGIFSSSGSVFTGSLARWSCLDPVPDPADLTNDSVVDGLDLALLLDAWGQCPVSRQCPADLYADGVVNGADLAMLLGSWG
jgi:hypothetical protein